MASSTTPSTVFRISLCLLMSKAFCDLHENIRKGKKKKKKCQQIFQAEWRSRDKAGRCLCGTYHVLVGFHTDCHFKSTTTPRGRANQPFLYEEQSRGLKSVLCTTLKVVWFQSPCSVLYAGATPKVKWLLQTSDEFEYYNPLFFWRDPQRTLRTPDFDWGSQI